MPEEKKSKIGVACGFENKHNTNEEKSICVLDSGHEGDHFDGKYGFSDAAGVPLPKEVREKLDARKKK